MNDFSQMALVSVYALSLIIVLLLISLILFFVKSKNDRKLLSFLTQSISDIIWRIDTDYKIIYVSPADKKMRGFDTSEVVGTSIMKHLSDNSKSLIDMLREIRVDEESRGMYTRERTIEADLVCKDGSTVTVEIIINYEYEQQKLKGFSGVARDITVRKHSEDQLYFMANNDALTKLSNRRSFMDMANREFDNARRYNKPLSVLMFDIDKFKLVNDTYGHHAGDVVLQHVADLGIKQLRNTDIIGRLGGEEFAVMTTETDVEGAVQVAEKIRKAYEATSVEADGHMIRFTVSIGVATLSTEDRSFETMLKRADDFLYEAKNTGRNRTIFFK